MSSQTTSASGSQTTQVRILDATAEEMANCGLNGVRIEHVAARAGCNKALIYRYFYDRETLFVEAFRHQLAKRLSILGELPEGLAAMLQHWTEQTLNDRAFVRLIIREAMDYDGGTQLESEARRSYYATQISMVRELQKRGVVDGEFDAAMLFLALLSLIMLPALLPQIVFLASENFISILQNSVSVGLSSSNICQSICGSHPLRNGISP